MKKSLNSLSKSTVMRLLSCDNRLAILIASSLVIFFSLCATLTRSPSLVHLGLFVLTCCINVKVPCRAAVSFLRQPSLIPQTDPR